MSYLFGAGLQESVYARLAADETVAALTGGAVFDAPPALSPDQTEYVLIGEETVRPNGTTTSVGALHDFTVTVHSGREGFEGAKRIAAAVCGALVDAPLEIVGGRVVAMRFLRAGAERGVAPAKRTISLRFRAVVDQDD